MTFYSFTFKDYRSQRISAYDMAEAVGIFIRGLRALLIIKEPDEILLLDIILNVQVEEENV